MYTPIAKPKDRIAEAMKLAGINATELAERTGLNKSSISCWLSGRYEPKQTALYKMGKALDCAEMWLAGYDVSRERSQEQKTAELLADVLSRAQQDEEYRSLLAMTYSLDATQVQLCSQLISQLTASAENR